MFDRRRPILNSTLLHGLLIAGAVVFALPYAWLVGTSWKLDKEVQSAEIRILPQKPIPAAHSPYIDTRQFPPITPPESVTTARWNGWMRAAVTDEIDRAVREWRDPRAEPLPRRVVDAALAEGVFGRLRNLIPYDTWKQADQPALRAAVRDIVTPDLIRECFDQAYRFFAVSTLRLQTQDYRVFDLSADRAPGELWRLVRDTPPAAVQLEHSRDAGRIVTRARYDFAAADRFTLTATATVPGVDLADPNTGFKRIELAYHSDQTWHDMRVTVDFAGTRYRAVEPKYLATDQWWEVRYQLPGPDDKRLMPKRYILLEAAAHGAQYDPGPHTLVVRVALQKSSQLEAYWAKGTENYRIAFDEVPFWRYFKTSVFLVVVNILGTLLSCSLAAYAFARLNWPGRDLCFILVLATLMIPPQVTMIPSFVIYKYLGWYNTLAPLWVPNCLAVNGFAIFLLRQAMRGVPRDLEEAAKIDGAGHLRIYWNIVMPLMKPTLAAISIFTFMFVWNDFLGPLIYVNDQRLYPLALGLFSFMAGRENQFTLIMAGSMIMTLPVIITFFFAQRYFIQGVTMSGMKT
jgi:multiple sugar transport system permease protein